MCIYKLQYINASFIVIPLVKEQVAGVQRMRFLLTSPLLGASGTTNKTPPKKSSTWNPPVKQQQRFKNMDMFLHFHGQNPPGVSSYLHNFHVFLQDLDVHDLC